LYQGALIPESTDDMIGLSSFMGLDETDWTLRASFDHIPALQEAENRKLDTLQKQSNLLINELNNKLITPEIYWQRMGYGAIPPELKESAEEEQEEPKEETEDEKTVKFKVNGHHHNGFVHAN
jgi:hypothetical protein